ncbi:glutathione S-transferase N-terminal domain-containing protein [Fangia hongkongensis]|uniref:glutathione S-transferase N-terminal domain-containing protein n=1 Tax=Fangia hongkongensis TaxID=270495 RepID=UPI0003723891|nr:glutathione S-transferase N-terminal domain-containing protein [Fangia hongkongensis]MBK2124511.1 glutathione S-transferase N-terminal domain-containing protein [Fangia hongkongensis]
MYITLYIKKNCPYSHAARIALEEKRMAFQVIELDEKKDNEMILSLNPDGILPILKERDHVIYDPEVVMLYIDERYPAPSLLPNYPVERARTRLAMVRIEREWYSILHFIMTSKDKKKVDEAKSALIDSFKAIEPIFSENEFFMSDTMTLADCSLAALLHILPSIGITLDKSLGEINNYAERIFARESFQRTMPKQAKKVYRRH